MDNSEFSNSRDEINIDRCRANAVHDFKDAFERAHDDLAFKMGGVLGNAINDAAGDDPSARANAFYTATQSIEYAIQEHDWVTKRALRAFLQAFAS